MSHHLGASGIHQVDTYTNLEPVLPLRPLSKLLMVHQDQLPAASCMGPADISGGVGSEGVIRVRPAEFIGLKQTNIWSCGWTVCIGMVAPVTHVRGNRPPHPRATEFSL